ncbi:hypothetical protein NR798_35990 [Archangium gephyra]
MTVQSLLGLIALIVCIIHALNGRAPLWFAVLLLALAVVLPAIRVR